MQRSIYNFKKYFITVLYFILSKPVRETSILDIIQQNRNIFVIFEYLKFKSHSYITYW